MKENTPLKQKAAKSRDKKADTADDWSLGISDDWGLELSENWVDPNEFEWDLGLNFSPEDNAL